MHETAVMHAGNTGHTVAIDVEYIPVDHDHGTRTTWRCLKCPACGVDEEVMG